MLTVERIQAVIHKLEVDTGARWLNYLVLTLAIMLLGVWYDTHCYHSFNAPAAMDAAQVARNLATGKGYSSECVRPFGLHLLQQHNGAAAQAPGTNEVDAATVNALQPDLANAPLYPTLLAGLFKVTSPKWTLELEKPFWGGGGHFSRYKPEFHIAILNQFLLVAAVFLTFILTRTLFDHTLAWLAALLMVGSDVLWKFSVSGLPTLLLLDIFLCLIWCLVAFEAAGAGESPNGSRRFQLALVTGLLAGLGTLTLYAFGWVMLPVVLYFLIFGGAARTRLSLGTLLVFAVVLAPWIARNLMVSGTFFGTAGYAILENSMRFPGSDLMQSLDPNMTGVYGVKSYLVKLQAALHDLLPNGVPGIGGGWIGCLFLAGLLLGLRNVAARRLRYFTMMCLVVFLFVTALGQTTLGAAAPETNEENFLVLLTPLGIIFGLVFFLTLLDQMDLAWVPVRYAVIGLVVLLACQQLLFTLLPPKIRVVSYPPYNPVEIQRLSQWIHPNELMMSDLPWAVAWYGDRSCTWTTLDAGPQFYQLNDYIKHVSALYLSEQTMDGRLLSDCLLGGKNSWSGFIFERVGVRKLTSEDAPDAWNVYFRTSADDPRRTFPLHYAPQEVYSSGIFLTDRTRW